MKKVIVKLENLSKSYGDKEIIKNINLEIYEKEFLTILGPSGCGKTTILRSISGLDHPTTGKVFIDGVDVTNLEPPKRQVNTIFQNYALFPFMTIEENIAFGLKMKKINKKEIKKRVNEMLQLVHLEGYEKRKPKQLSGGEQQRVSLVRGLINNPKVLLLDEPLSALDLKLRKQMQVELKQLQKKLGITFIYVTHDQDEALSMSDRIIVLEKGIVRQIGTPIEVYENPNSIYVADFLGDANIFESKIIDIKNDKIFLENNIVAKNNNFKINDKVNLVIRPEDIKVTKVEKENNFLKGIVTEQIYDGSFTKILVKFNKKIIQVLMMGSDKEYHKNDEIFLYWDINDVVVLGSEVDEKK